MGTAIATSTNKGQTHLRVFLRSPKGPFRRAPSQARQCWTSPLLREAQAIEFKYLLVDSRVMQCSECANHRTKLAEIDGVNQTPTYMGVDTRGWDWMGSLTGSGLELP